MGISVERLDRATMGVPDLASFDAVGFGIDGTLVYTRRIQKQTLRVLHGRHVPGVPVPLTPEVLCLGYPRHLERLGLGECREEYWRTLGWFLPLAPRVTDLLETIEALADAEVPVFLVTDLPQEAVEGFLERSGVRDLVDTVVTVPHGTGAGAVRDGILEALRRLEVDPAAAAFVGDTPEEVAASRDAGLFTVAAGWGRGAFPDLAASGADLVLMATNDLRRLVLGDGVFAPARCPACPQTLSPGRARGLTVMCDDACPARSHDWLLTVPPGGPRCRTCGAPDPEEGASGRCAGCRLLEERGELHIDRIVAAAALDDAPDAAPRSPLGWALRRFRGLDGHPADRRHALGLATLFLASAFARWHRMNRVDVDRHSAAFHPLPGIVVPVAASPESVEALGFDPVRELLAAFFLPLILKQPEFRSRRPMPAREILDLPWRDIKEIVNRAAAGIETGFQWRVMDLASLDLPPGIEPGSWEATLHEMGGAENLKMAARGARIYLVDDVVATGASINRWARVLKDAGAARVEGIALARSVEEPARPDAAAAPR